jgi:hypothetical protein
MSAALADRGYRVLYRPGGSNVCPGCGGTHWHVGRSSAECASCCTALPFVAAEGRLQGGCSARFVRPERIRR